MSRRRKFLIVVVFGMAILVPVIRHYQLRFAVAAYIAELKAKGEPMDLAQVIPPPVPPEQNGAPLIMNSLTNLEYENIDQTNPPPAMRIVVPGRAMIGWQQPNIHSSDGSNTWEELGAELTNEKNTIASFQSLTNHLALDFDLDYQQGLSIRLAHLAPLRRAAQRLSSSALYNLHQGHVKDACANVDAMLAIVKGQTDEPLGISQLVRMAITHISADATWEILQNTNASENDLALLQQGWQSLEFTKQVERAYLMERVMRIRSLEQARQNPSELWNSISGNGGIQRLWHENQWRWFWSYADEKLAAQIYQVLIDATRIAETNHSFQSAQLFTSTNFVQLGLERPQARGDFVRMDIDEFGMHWMCSDDARDSFAVLRKALATETAQNVVVTAIALKRYELRQHQLPDTLEKLTPVFVKTVPIDCMDGQLLRYRPYADGTFLLYSVGENGKDDGGNPSLEKNVEDSNFYWQNPYAFDRVWPQPATDEEIQKYYDNQSKNSRN